ncbi:hypothetical protein LOSG293_290060 [Secundilactobacillus oryzae JCM 18671]|uniref:CamS family sex pheromone protein n=1 Tax=Secundilactobacillus oryzae JCM 18671 TaxID=1291743 RepID=A0A081BK47_9LACO|nr:hypothetical protein LOSG293_290060 [Secundilactobacillus oryzae JCM 18671]
MKRAKLVIGLLGIMLFLAACGNLNSSSMSSSGTNGSKGTQLTGQSTDSNYEGVIENGKYVTSKSRGVSNTQDAGNQLNLKSFEKGLLNVSQQEFSTNKYAFREGQILTKKVVSNWLARESKSNADGLNPKDNGSTSATKRNPIYLQQLEEQDYMIQKNNKLSLGGITIGLGINSVDYYKKTQYGATYETKISKAEAEKQGKAIANKVLMRLRQYDSLKNVPIVIALYRQASDDSLVGGNFFAYSVNKNGTTKVKSWEKLNQKSYVFPIADSQTSPNTNDTTSFDNFKNEVEDFFPNLSGVTAQAQYTNNQLDGMNVNITTQFYSQTEIISFTQFLQTAAQKYLPAKVPIDIQVSSTEGVQSFLSRSENGKKFTTHVFNSY